MFPWLLKIIKKTKDDAPSKALYDVVKYFTLVIGGYVIVYYVALKRYFTQDVNLTYWKLPVIFIIGFAGGILVISLYYRIISKRYVSIIDNLIEKSLIDDLTGLYNHKAFSQKIIEAIECSTTKPTSLIIIDIDNFKKFNDDYSYEDADIVIRKVANLLRDDKRNTDTIFRYHGKGDEFLILANNTDLNNATIAGRRKKEAIEEKKIKIKDTYVNVTVSCGVIQIDPMVDNTESLMTRVQEALKVAKAQLDKNSVVAIA